MKQLSLARQYAAAMFVLAMLAGCGGGSSKSSPPASPTTASPTTTVSHPAGTTAEPRSASTSEPTSEAASGSIQERWCALKLGDAKAEVVAAMSDADGHKADAYRTLIAAGRDLSEWDRGNDIYVAAFTDGAATSLLAYDLAVGPKGAAGLPCEPFRNAG